ncbi:unnamed protein product [marine sediment metagenome]|uniref:Uncharacterized protein n=1 Tax=marine sediment metagenome TaxID=412755 RepID=X1DBL9_9ZZZZ
MIDVCKFCGRVIESDGTDEDRYKMLVFHVWMHHYEKGQGRTLREVLEFGPFEGEEE